MKAVKKRGVGGGGGGMRREEMVPRVEGALSIHIPDNFLCLEPSVGLHQLSCSSTTIFSAVCEEALFPWSEQIVSS